MDDRKSLGGISNPRARQTQSDRVGTNVGEKWRGVIRNRETYRLAGSSAERGDGR